MRRGRNCLLAVIVALVSVLGPAPAWAATTTQVVQGEVLRLVSVADWDAAARLLPGVPVRWDVAVSADAPDPGTVHIALSARGDAPLILDVSLCSREWAATGCPGRTTELRTAWRVPLDGTEIPLTEIADTDVARLRLSITLDPAGVDGSTQVRVHAEGAGESVVVGPDGGLATTGMSPAVPWVLAAGMLLVAIGIVLLSPRRRRRPAEEDPP